MADHIGPHQPPQNGTVSVATFQDSAGKFFLAIVHVDHNGDPEIVGEGFADIDAAKSAAWTYAQAHGASFVSTKKIGGRS